MKVMIDFKLNGELKKNDIIIYNEKSGIFENIRYDDFVQPLKNKDMALQNEIEQLKEDFKDYKTKVNEKLKSYHEILNIVSKGE